ncbi:MAG: peptidylprolyl isomerase [Candidatus Aenigmarchaeota archaeon]|nr:peptidylprolyl isomerase [Candidatus Aenigmarchaeota archaeon]
MHDGDFILLDFVGRVADTGKVFDCTLQEDAEREGIRHPRHAYRPALVILGAHMVIPGLEERLKGLLAGQEKEFTIPPAEAFGPRSPGLVRTLPLAAFLRQKVQPVPNDVVDVDGAQGRVQSVSGGRVRVDFNHPLAGKSLAYRVRITKQLATPQEQVEELLRFRELPATATVAGEQATITGTVPAFAQAALKDLITKWVKGITVVTFAGEGAAPSPAAQPEASAPPAPKRARAKNA